MAVYSIGDILVDHVFNKHYLVEDIVSGTITGQRYSLRHLERNTVVDIRVLEVDHNESGFEKVV